MPRYIPELSANSKKCMNSEHKTYFQTEKGSSGCHSHSREDG